VDYLFLFFPLLGLMDVFLMKLLAYPFNASCFSCNYKHSIGDIKQNISLIYKLKIYLMLIPVLDFQLVQFSFKLK